MRLLQTYGPVYAPESMGSAHELPPYAILSHTWNHGQEVTFEDLVMGAGRDKSGWSKIEFCRDRAVMDGLSHFWIDSCCIPTTRWCRAPSSHRVHVPVVSRSSVVDAGLDPLTASGTAMRSVLQHAWRPLGDKATFEDHIFKATPIPLSALRGWSMSSFTIQERRSWLDGRETTYPEDQENCLIGILGFEYVRRHAEAQNHSSLLDQREAELQSEDSEQRRQSHEPSDLVDEDTSPPPGAELLPQRGVGLKCKL